MNQTETVNTYEQQANDFLTATNTTFKSEFLKFGYHFTDDKHKRNIFKITLSNDRHTYSFDFGSSLHDSLKNSNDVIYEKEIDFFYGIKYEGLKREYLSYSAKINIDTFKDAWSKGGNNVFNLLIDKKKATEVYNEYVKVNTGKYSALKNILPLSEWLQNLQYAITRKGGELSQKNFGEGIQAQEISHPNAYDILTCLQEYDTGTFENFCSEFGYDTDSRSAEKTYNAVCEEWENVSKLFTTEQIEQLQEIQ